MSTILITGANKGLGHEAARRLIAAGHDVWAAARDATAGQEAAQRLGARFVQLDVTDDASVPPPWRPSAPRAPASTSSSTTPASSAR